MLLRVDEDGSPLLNQLPGVSAGPFLGRLEVALTGTLAF